MCDLINSTNLNHFEILTILVKSIVLIWFIDKPFSYLSLFLISRRKSIWFYIVIFLLHLTFLKVLLFSITIYKHINYFTSIYPQVEYLIFADDIKLFMRIVSVINSNQIFKKIKSLGARGTKYLTNNSWLYWNDKILFKHQV